MGSLSCDKGRRPPTAEKGMNSWGKKNFEIRKKKDQREKAIAERGGDVTAEGHGRRFSWWDRRWCEKKKEVVDLGRGKFKIFHKKGVSQGRGRNRLTDMDYSEIRGNWKRSEGGISTTTTGGGVLCVSVRERGL